MDSETGQKKQETGDSTRTKTGCGQAERQDGGKFLSFTTVLQIMAVILLIIMVQILRPRAIEILTRIRTT